MGSDVKVPFLDLSPQTKRVSSRYLSRLASLVENNRFIGGEPVSAFERSFANFCGTEFCVGLNSGTDALRLGLLAAGIGPEDEVVTSPFTFIATAEAINQTSRLKLADVDPETFTLSPDCVSECLSPATKAILPVHIFGLSAEMPRLLDLANRHDLLIIEDACQAHGAAIDGQRVGSFGLLGAFSFYPSKNLGAFGDAGAVTCNDPEVAERLRLLRNHGQIGPYRHGFEGYNSRLDSFQAEVLNLKLELVEEWNDQREELVAVYRRELEEVPEVWFQRIPPGYRHIYHVLAVLAERRSELVDFLLTKGIETRVIYPVPVHLNPAYEWLGLPEGSFPNAERVSDSVVCLPVYPGLTESQVLEVTSQIKQFYSRRN